MLCGFSQVIAERLRLQGWIFSLQASLLGGQDRDLILSRGDIGVDVVDFFDVRWETLRNFYYRGRYKRWLETLACYEGFWYYDFDTALRRFSDVAKIPPWRIRLVLYG